MDHEQTKKIFKNWNIFLKESYDPQKLEKRDEFEKELQKLLNLTYDYVDNPSGGVDSVEILEKLRQLKNYAVGFDKRRATEDTPKFFAQLVNEYEPTIMLLIQAAPGSEFPELDAFARMRNLNQRRQGPSIRARTRQEDYVQAYRRFQGLPPKSYVPRRDLKAVIDTVELFIDVMKPVDALDWAILTAEIIIPGGFMLGLASKSKKLSRLSKLARAGKASRYTRKLKSASKATKARRVAQARYSREVKNAKRIIKKYKYFKARNMRMLIKILQIITGFTVSIVFWEEIEKDIREASGMTPAEKLKQQQLAEKYSSKLKPKQENYVREAREILEGMSRAAQGEDGEFNWEQAEAYLEENGPGVLKNVEQ